MKKYIYIILFSLISLSCVKTYPLDLKEEQDKLVLNSIIDTKDTIHVVYLSISNTRQVRIPNPKEVMLNVNINGSTLSKENIEVMPLYEDDTTEEPESYNKKALGFEIKAKLKEGDIMEVEASYRGLHAKAKAETLKSPAINKVDTINTTITHPYYGERKAKIFEINMSDFPDARNFYRLEIYTLVQIRRMDGSPFTLSDSEHRANLIYDDEKVLNKNYGRPEEASIFEFSNDNAYHVFNDSYFENKDYTLKVKITNEDLYDPYPYIIPSFPEKDGKKENLIVKKETIIRVYSLTDLCYRYLLALNNLELNETSILSEGIIVPQNVEEGMGSFFITSPKEYRLKWKDQILKPDNTLYTE